MDGRRDRSGVSPHPRALIPKGNVGKLFLTAAAVGGRVAASSSVLLLIASYVASWVAWIASYVASWAETYVASCQTSDSQSCEVQLSLRNHSWRCTSRPFRLFSNLPPTVITADFGANRCKPSH